MAAEFHVTLESEKPAKIIKWKVKEGSRINDGTILGLYQVLGTDKIQKLRCERVGTVISVLISAGVDTQPGAMLLKVECCKHPTVMKDMCAECGADLRQDTGVTGEKISGPTATVAMVHSVPELIVSEEQAMALGKRDEQRLLDSRKLVLLVDLDQTLIHTTNDNVPNNLKDVYHFQLWHGRSLMWYHTRFRPSTIKFLDTISKFYELHICTFGVRMYAHTIARYLDPEGKYFSHRILSRDECFNPTSKTANLKALFPCGDSMVCIIDDREEVWKFSPNLVHVKPYFFFDGTADINAPPEAEKGQPGESQEDGEPKQRSARRPRRNVTVLRIPKTKAQAGKEVPEASYIQEAGPETATLDSVEDASTHSATEEKLPREERNGDKEATDQPGNSDPKQPGQENGEEKQQKNSPENCTVQGITEQSVVSEDSMEITDTQNINTDQEHPTPDLSDSDSKASGCESLAEKCVQLQVTDCKVTSGAEHITAPLSTETEQSGTNSLGAALVGQLPDQSSTLMDANTSAAAGNDGGGGDDTAVSSNKMLPVVDTDLKCSVAPEGDQGKPLAVSCVETSSLSPNPEVTIASDQTEHVPAQETSELTGKKDLSMDTGSGGPDAEVTVPDQGSKTKTEAAPVQETPEVSKATVPDGKNEEEYEEWLQWEDTDDYLIYLEDILKKIHTAFYEVYDQLQQKKSLEVPNLKNVVPYVRKKVLKGANLVFSGVIPTNHPMEKHRAYTVAKALGANVCTDLTEAMEDGSTVTHLVAAKLGTTKVNAARILPGIKIVTPSWLWTCSERWEWVDERLFTLSELTSSPDVRDSPDVSKMIKSKRGASKPQPKEKPMLDTVSSDKEKVETKDEASTNPPAKKDQFPPIEERRFSDSYNPLYSFSKEDIDQMDEEVEKIFDESASEESEDLGEDTDEELRQVVLGYGQKRCRESSSEESLSGEFPRGWGMKHQKRHRKETEGDNDEDPDDENEDKRRLIEDPGCLMKLTDSESEESADSIGSIDEEMAAAVEKEFLSY